MTSQQNPRTKPARSAFTIVELLVALALVIFIMSLVSTVFVLATKSFRDMKAAGDLTEQLRSAGQLIRKMLKANHLTKTTNDFQLSDDTLWTPDDLLKPTQRSSYRWRSGYFRFEQTASFDDYEADDLIPKTIPVYRVGSSADHRLSMSCVLPNTRLPQDFFSTLRPGNFDTLFSTAPKDTYYEIPGQNNLNRRQMEMALFLAAADSASGDAAKTGLLSSDPNPRPLFSLLLKSWIINDSGDPLKDTISVPTSADTNELEKRLSGRQYTAGGKWTFNQLDNVSDKENRSTNTFFAATAGTRFAANPDLGAIILRNVISFEVRLLRKNAADFNEPNGPYIFDTDIQAALNDPGADSGRMISAIKIILRVYDPDNEITRQLTIVEPL